MIDEYFNQLLSTIRSELEGMEQRLRFDMQQMQDPEKISYTIEEAARITGLGYDTIYNRCKSGRLDFSQDGPGAAIIIKRQTLIDYVNANSSTGKVSSQPVQNDSRQVRLHGATLQPAHKRKRLTGD